MRLVDVDATIQALNVASRGDSKDVIRNLVIRFLLALPTVDAVPVRHGKWLKTDETEEWYGTLYKCSLCGCSLIGYGGYCPSCGAKMDRKEEE